MDLTLIAAHRPVAEVTPERGAGKHAKEPPEKLVGVPQG